MNGIVFDIKKYAIHDGPGIRTTIFLKGCPLKCDWCHNPESIKPECETITIINRKKTLNLSYSETKEVFGREVPSDDIMNEIKKDILFYDDSNGGVTFSGGEPMMQIDYLLELLTKCKELDLHTVVDTSGLSSWENFEKIIPFTDLFLFDLKILALENHKKYTGVGNELILQNLAKLAERKINVRIRIPLIPDITDTEENIKAIAEFLKPIAGIKNIDLLPFNNIAESKYRKLNKQNKLINLKKQDQQKIESLKTILESAGFDVKVGG